MFNMSSEDIGFRTTANAIQHAQHAELQANTALPLRVFQRTGDVFLTSPDADYDAYPLAHATNVAADTSNCNATGIAAEPQESATWDPLADQTDNLFASLFNDADGRPPTPETLDSLSSALFPQNDTFPVDATDLGGDSTFNIFSKVSSVESWDPLPSTGNDSEHQAMPEAPEAPEIPSLSTTNASTVDATGFQGASNFAFPDESWSWPIVLPSEPQATPEVSGINNPPYPSNTGTSSVEATGAEQFPSDYPTFDNFSAESWLTSEVEVRATIEASQSPPEAGTPDVISPASYQGSASTPATTPELYTCSEGASPPISAAPSPCPSPPLPPAPTHEPSPAPLVSGQVASPTDFSARPMAAQNFIFARPMTSADYVSRYEQPAVLPRPVPLVGRAHGNAMHMPVPPVNPLKRANAYYADATAQPYMFASGNMGQGMLMNHAVAGTTAQSYTLENNNMGQGMSMATPLALTTAKTTRARRPRAPRRKAVDPSQADAQTVNFVAQPSAAAPGAATKRRKTKARGPETDNTPIYIPSQEFLNLPLDTLRDAVSTSAGTLSTKEAISACLARVGFVPTKEQAAAGVKMYCHYCKEAVLIQPTNFIRHLADIHLDAFRRQCPVCEAWYTRKDSFKRHLDKKPLCQAHPDNAAPRMPAASSVAGPSGSAPAA